jgi:hypothetical protein
MNAIHTDLSQTAESTCRFIFRIVQPGLVSLMDGSVSSLAPLFLSLPSGDSVCAWRLCGVFASGRRPVVRSAVGM